MQVIIIINNNVTPDQFISLTSLSGIQFGIHKELKWKNIFIAAAVCNIILEGTKEEI